MKITGLFLFILIFCLHAENTNSQNIRVTIKQTNAELEDVLNVIEKQTDYLFVYNKYVNVDRKVSVNLNKRPLAEVLKSLFEGTDIKYTIDGAYIILSAQKESSDDTPSAISQQGRRITGVVKDESGEPVIGANIIEKGSSNGVISDVDGKFYISVSANAVLQVSYIGYEMQEIPVGNQTTLQIIMKEDLLTLEDVVVIGYGVQRKKDVAGSISSLSTKDLSIQSAGNIQNLLQGRMSGVSVSSSGVPGEAPFNTHQGSRYVK